MSRVILEKVAAYVGAIPGVATKYFRWTDADTAGGSAPFIAYISGGEMDSDPVKQEYEVLITLVHNPESVKDASDMMAAIVKKLRAVTSMAQVDIIRMDPIGGVRGPNYLENGRPVFDLRVRVQAQGF